MTDPRTALLEGAEILEKALSPHSFVFQFRGEGSSSGGPFAWGEFVRQDRRLEFHFRWSLGMVRYHAGASSVSHEGYMRELGVWEQCHHPGFQAEAAGQFAGLSHDIGFAHDFLSGSAEVLSRAATKEAQEQEVGHRKAIAGYVGDDRKREKLRILFHQGRYHEVVKVVQELKYPELMSESERRMVAIARKKACDP